MQNYSLVETNTNYRSALEFIKINGTTMRCMLIATKRGNEKVHSEI